jgi:hypothetical protein
MSRSYTPLPPNASMACRGTAFYFYFTSKRTQLSTITNISLLTLFKEIIPVYNQKYTKNLELLIIKSPDILTKLSSLDAVSDITSARNEPVYAGIPYRHI